MHSYRVGQSYLPGRTQWPEVGEYNYRAGGHELRLFLSRLTLPDIAAIREGPISLGVYVEAPVIVFLYRFGNAVPLSDAPYDFWRVADSERTIPAEDSGSARALLSIVLTDADTGIIRALRVVSMSSSLTRALHGAIRAQASTPDNPGEYDARLAALYARASSADLWRRASATQTVTR